jgi:uncharacterized protein YeaO (DUF488 family)
MIQIERVYGHTSADGSKRFLVERLWPRGVKKESLALDAWLRDAAPSAELRRWFSHDPAKWKEFRRRYEEELAAHPEAWQALLQAARRGRVTLLYSARDTEHNSALLLKEFLERKL